MDSSLLKRGKALENHFFGSRDRELLDQLKTELAKKESREALAAVSGIMDESMLDALISCKVTAETMASVSLIPLVLVAWANGQVEDAERSAVLQACEAAGIEPDSASFQLVHSWLKEKPGDELGHAWKAYIHALKEPLDDTAFDLLRVVVIQRARKVAQVAGGILGLGSTSDREAQVIASLEQAFE